MWQNILDWVLNIFASIGSFASLLFTKVSELPDYTIHIGNLNVTISTDWLSNILPNFKVIDIVSITGLTLVIIILIFKKVWIF